MEWCHPKHSCHASSEAQIACYSKQGQGSQPLLMIKASRSRCGRVSGELVCLIRKDNGYSTDARLVEPHKCCAPFHLGSCMQPLWDKAILEPGRGAHVQQVHQALGTHNVVLHIRLPDKDPVLDALGHDKVSHPSHAVHIVEVHLQKTCS